MIAPFPSLSAKERTRRRPMPRTGEQVYVPPAPGQVDGVQDRPPAEPAASLSADEPLRCLWYRAGLADTLGVVDEFLRTPAATAALADFCRTQPGRPAAPLEAHTLAGAVAFIVARMCP
jgi:hypothetical protein